MKLNENYPYWFRLIRHFEDRAYIRNGLTLPYISGALTILDPENTPPSVRELLDEFLNHKGDFRVSMLFCGNLREYVFGIVDKETEQFIQNYRTGLLQSYNRLLPIDGASSKYSDSTELIADLEKRYQRLIDQSDFSKSQGRWSYFAEKDLSRINETKK